MVWQKSAREALLKPCSAVSQGTRPHFQCPSVWTPADTGFNRDAKDVCRSTRAAEDCRQLHWCPLTESTAAFALGIHLHKSKDLKGEGQGGVLPRVLIPSGILQPFNDEFFAYLPWR